jgi:hypothetical protein
LLGEDVLRMSVNAPRVTRNQHCPRKNLKCPLKQPGALVAVSLNSTHGLGKCKSGDAEKRRQEYDKDTTVGLHRNSEQQTQSAANQEYEWIAKPGSA